MLLTTNFNIFLYIYICWNDTDVIVAKLVTKKSKARVWHAHQESLVSITPKVYWIDVKYRIQTVEIHVLHEWCIYMQNFESFEFICYTVKWSKKWTFYYKLFYKSLIWWSRNFYCSQQNNNFQKCLINSKKIPKNIKFGLLAHFNMEITSNGLDRSFGL